MERDSKIYIDALNSSLSSIEYSISTILSNVFELSKGFVQCVLSWVRRELVLLTLLLNWLLLIVFLDFVTNILYLLL